MLEAGDLHSNSSKKRGLPGPVQPGSRGCWDPGAPHLHRTVGHASSKNCTLCFEGKEILKEFKLPYFPVSHTVCVCVCV